MTDNRALERELLKQNDTSPEDTEYILSVAEGVSAASRTTLSSSEVSAKTIAQGYFNMLSTMDLGEDKHFIFSMQRHSWDILHKQMLAVSLLGRVCGRMHRTRMLARFMAYVSRVAVQNGSTVFIPIEVEQKDLTARALKLIIRMYAWSTR